MRNIREHVCFKCLWREERNSASFIIADLFAIKRRFIRRVLNFKNLLCKKSKCKIFLDQKIYLKKF